MDELEALSNRQFAQLAERARQTTALLQADATLRHAACQVFLGSDFVLRSVIQDDGLLQALVASGDLATVRTFQDYRALFASITEAEVPQEASIATQLRQLRRRELVRIAWRDLTGATDTGQTLQETSWLADAMVAAATQVASKLVALRHGLPADGDDGLIVLAMGKLGGSELNFSSDIDLIFLHSASEETRGEVPIAAEDFYTRQARVFIRLLDAVTEDGFVYRVDMRLRPFGDSGPLVTSFAFLESYLQTHGREWERYAYVKARALTGVEAFAPLQESVLRPFVYRRYLDFGVFDSLREMKALISRDVVRRELADNIKLGPGGIREIEFITQAFQLVRGGQDARLREPSLLKVLPNLAGSKLLPAETVADLGLSYDFLRRLENRLQMLGDEQTHSLPRDPLQLRRIARSLQCADVAALQAAIALHRASVSVHFSALFSDAAQVEAGAAIDLSPLWEAEGDTSALADRLHAIGFTDLQTPVTQLVALRNSRLRRLDDPGRRRLKALLERVLCELPQPYSPDLSHRVFSVFEAIGQRSAYFSLLLENNQARARLIRICAQGDFLANLLVTNPALLDELIDERWQDLPVRTELLTDLANRMSTIASEDVERAVETLSRFKQAAVFRIALADVAGALPLMQVSDRLTDLAEVILQFALQMAWQQMVPLLGVPCCRDAAGVRSVRIAALGYGKLGGRELAYGSDLDLVFVHDSTGDAQVTNRAEPVDNQVFMLRFAQRLLHLLSVHSNAGRLYEVDVRLRPSGKGGMMVTSVEAFRRYQFEEAWTWEHQALLHARAVAGDADLMTQLEAIRLDVLAAAVRRTDLREQIAQMRERMRRELSAAKPGEFDLKQDRGGIADIEFLAQYWALRWAADYPPVAHFSDTIRQLESVASAGLVSQHTVDTLVRAYQSYRLVGHHRSLAGLAAVIEATAFAAERAEVGRIWQQTLGDSTGAATGSETLRDSL
jgi:[glutamine synthetase] adenylyltransferase / [glutamine synthetase]-adenylyl-L-tyrosine phosphorylase